MDPALTDSERERYSRQMLLTELGETGQMKLKQSSVLLVGTGALGSPASLYLAAAGVGRLVVVDDDSVEISNLHRQILHRHERIGQPKAESARATLEALNPDIILEAHSMRFTPDNAVSTAYGCDLIVDGCDNFPTRFLTNDLGFFHRIPVVHGAIDRFHGQVSVFAPHLGGPCYRCLLPTLPPPGAVPSCQEAGVIGSLPGIIGSTMAMEAIKLLLGIGSPLIGRLQIHDVLAAEHRTLRLRKDPLCALCGNHASIHSLHNPETTAAQSCATIGGVITAADLQTLLQNTFNGIIVDVREPHEHAARHIKGAILIPLGQLPDRYRELPRDQEIILHCKMGGRSGKALAFLLSQGFEQIRHLEGGMDAWNEWISNQNGSPGK